MKPLLPGALVVLVAVGVTAAQDSRALDRVIRGQVVDADSGVPLRRARVSIPSGPEAAYPVYTNEQGWFEIAVPQRCTSDLRIVKAGYTVASLESDQDACELRIAMSRSAAISGRVFDAFGVPVRAAYVTARLVDEDAVRRLVDGDAVRRLNAGRFFTRTDNWGEYRLGGLPPGRYEIVAAQSPERRNAGTSLEDQLFGPRSALVVADGTVTADLRAGDVLHNLRFIFPGSMARCPAAASRVRAPASAGTSSLSGRVTAASGEPLACALVRIVAPDTPNPTAYADHQGRFSFVNLPPGSYVVEASYLDYAALQHGQRDPSDPIVPVRVRAGERRDDIDIALPRGSVISGRVLDEYGEPLQGVVVTAQPWLGSDFTTAASTVTPGATDDRGQYRLIAQGMGTYVVSAAISGAVADAALERHGYAPTFYPGTTDAASAARLSVDTGRDVTGIDIVARPVFLAVVTGSVFKSSGEPFAGNVTLTTSSRFGAPRRSWSAPIDANGAFVIPNVPNGDYTLRAPGTTGGIPPLLGMRAVAVRDDDPAPVTVIVSAGTIVEGRIVVERVANAHVSGFGVTAEPSGPDVSPLGPHPTAGSQTDGTFRLEGVRGPSRFRLTAMPACDGCYLKRASIGALDVTNRPFDFGWEGGLQHVEIVVSRAGGSIAGRAVDETGTGVPLASVLLFSTDRTLWFPRSQYVRSVFRTAIDGTFRLDAIPPGDYFLVASADASAMGPTEPVTGAKAPETLERLASRAERITIAESDRQTVRVRINQ